VNASILPSFVRTVVDSAAAPWQGEEGRPEFLIDVYCGVGLFALAGRIALESQLTAFLRNAKLNRISNATFIRGDARKGLARVAKEIRPEAPARSSAVVVDPPRE
ncbi:TRM2, partial [Symbiodinium microadriaticum]